MKLSAFLVIQFCFCVLQVDARLCQKKEACRVIERSMIPHTHEETTTVEGSGQGSGSGATDPMDPELGHLINPVLYPYPTEASHQQEDDQPPQSTLAPFTETTLCDCTNGACPTHSELQNEKSHGKADHDEEDKRVVKLDAFVSLVTCRPLADVLPACADFRNPISIVYKEQTSINTPPPIVGLSRSSFIRQLLTAQNYTQARIYCWCKSGHLKRSEGVESFNQGKQSGVAYICSRHK